MYTISKKKIKGKYYDYANYSFRLPNKKIKKISKYIKDINNYNKKEIETYFFEKEIEQSQKYALEKYKPNSILTNDKINKIEKTKIEYKHLIKKLSKKQFKDILNRFTINFTYESNAIEGNSLTLKDVTLMLMENISPKNKELREIYETRNTREANTLLFDKKLKLNIENIIKFHSLLIKDTDVNPGFKKIPNYLLMRDVETTPPELVKNEIIKLVEWYNLNIDSKHLFEIVSEFHARFEKIHPFEDGNGRIGRFLINAILMNKGYPPIIIRKTVRTSYFAALEAFDKGFKNKLHRFILEKYFETFKKFFKVYVKYI